MTTMESLTRYLAWLRCPGCCCPWTWRTYGYHYGAAPGEGWVRRSPHPDCLYHGTAAAGSLSGERRRA